MVFFKKRLNLNQNIVQQKITRTDEFLIVGLQTSSNISDISSDSIMYPIGRSKDNLQLSSQPIYSQTSTDVGQLGYIFDFSIIPNNAFDISLSLSARAWSRASNDTFMIFLIKSNVITGSALDFSSALSSQIKTTSSVIRNVSDFQDMQLYVNIGSSGGYFQGATVTVTYSYYE